MHLRALFAAGPGRGEQFVAEGVGPYLDASKLRITAEWIRLLLASADGCDLRDGIEAILAADHPVLAERDDAELAMHIQADRASERSGRSVDPPPQRVMVQGGAATPGGRHGCGRPLGVARIG